MSGYKELHPYIHKGMSYNTPKPMSPRTHLRPRGATLIELSVVIMMLLSLISALFISAKYYKEASDRAACVTLLSQYQKAIRAYQNLNSLSFLDTVPDTDFYGDGKPFDNVPTCPLGNGAYTLLGKIPPTGEPYATCYNYDTEGGKVDKSQEHRAENLSAW